jgi:ComEC/Rec2-related protein
LLPFLALFFLPRKKGISFILICLIFILGCIFGNFIYQKNIERYEYFKNEIVLGKDEAKLRVEGVVKTLAYTSELSETYVVSFDNFAKYLSWSEWENRYSFSLFVEVPKNMKLSEGQRISFTENIKIIEQDIQNGFFRYSFGQWIVGKVFVSMPEKSGNIWWLEQIRATIRKNILLGFPEKEAGIILWMTVGDKSLLVKEIRENFMNTGTTHILVVSGANIALILILVSSILRYVPIRWWIKSICIILSILFYSLLVGFDIPVLRAMCMGILSYLAIMGGKNLSSISILGGIAFLFSLLDPLGLVYDPSFGLSFWATLGILLFWKDITNWLWKRYFPEWISGSIAVTIGASIGSLPAIIYHFWNLIVSWVLVNILIGIFVWVIMIGGIFYILLSITGKLFLYAVGLCIYLPTTMLVWITDIFSGGYVLTLPESYRSTIMIILVWLIFSILFSKELEKFHEKDNLLYSK